MPQQNIQDTVALVTGANRGIGRAFVEVLLERGAKKVYAGARRPETLDDLVQAYPDRVVALQLDVTEPEDVAAAAAQATDVQLLVNNAGVAATMGLPIVDPAQNDPFRQEMEVNVFGLLSVTQSLLPALRASGGGAIVNLGSIASLVSFAMAQGYSATKAAVHSITQGLRVSLPDTLVVGVYPGPIDTDMAEEIPFEKTPPTAVAHAVLDGVEAGTEDVFPDYMSKEMGGAFMQDPKGVELQNREMAAEMAAQAAGG